MVTLTDADAGHLVPIAPTRPLLLCIPVEHGCALVERLLDKGRGERPTILADLAVGVRRIDLTDRDPVDAEFARRLIHHGLERGHELVLAGTALWSGRRRIGEHRHGAIAHGLGLVEEGGIYAGG